MACKFLHEQFHCTTQQQMSQQLYEQNLADTVKEFCFYTTAVKHDSYIGASQLKGPNIQENTRSYKLRDAYQILTGY